MEIVIRKIVVVQALKTRDLEAYYGKALLWTKTAAEPGSTEEVVEFYTFTLIELLTTLERFSNHRRISFLARAEEISDAEPSTPRSGLLGNYPEQS